MASTAGYCTEQITANQQTYCSQLSCCEESASDQNQGGGYNWITMPYIGECDGVTTVVMGACQNYSFELDDDEYIPMYGALQTLTADSGAGTLTFGNTDGSTIDFNDSSGTSGPPGTFKRYTAPGGDTLEVQSYAYNSVEEIYHSTTTGGVTTTDSYLTAFVSSGVNTGLRSSAILRRTTDGGSHWTELRKTVFEYYTGAGGDFGNAGDLKTRAEQIKDGSGNWVTLRTYYFRYYKAGETGGFKHGLKFVVGPEAFTRIASPFSAADATIANYADNYYEYDNNRRVTKSVTQGGLLTYTIAYTGNSDSDDYNNWKLRTAITRPDGSVRIIYTNYIGQQLLSELKQSSDSWVEYNVFGTDGDDIPGKLVQTAMPSAVISYVDDSGGGHNKLSVTLRSSAGLIKVNDYYPTTSPGTGGAPARLKYTQVKEGSGGSLVRLTETKYTSRNVGDLTIYPVSDSIVYPIAGDTSTKITTSFAYTWQTSLLQVKTITTTLPLVSTVQNGSNSSNLRRQLFDIYGNQIATQDERNYINTTAYNVATGAMTQTILDDDAPSGSGWTANGGSRLKLTSNYESDSLGRITQTLGPIHDAVISNSNVSVRTASWTVYDDINHRRLTASGYASGMSYNTYALVDPVTLTYMDESDRVTQTIVSARTSTSGSGRLLASDVFDQPDWSRWSLTGYNNQDQMVSSRTYFLIPNSGQGAEGTHYNTTTFGYDLMNRQNKVQSPGGTIIRTVYDVRSLATKVYVGTNDASATDSDPTGGGAAGNNMVQVSASVYDGGSAGKNGDLTTATVYAASGDTRQTLYEYDFRSRRINEDGEVDVYIEYTYDNLNRVTETRRKANSSGGALIGKWQTFYDDMGRVYQTKTFAVASGSAGNALIGNNWYDAAGNLVASIAEGAGQYVYSKAEFDSVGRRSASYFSYNTASVSYTNSTTISSDDIIFEQSIPVYDEASNVLSTASFQRLNDATAGGKLSVGSNPKARASFIAGWFDGIGRTIASANYGSLSSLSRPSTPPARADDKLVTSIDYNSAGEGFSQTDPRGIVSQQTWDDAGRLVQRVDDYGSGKLNQTTAWAYTPDGQTATLTAANSSTGDQVTTYTYGTTLSNSDIARSDLLRYVDYPDSVSGSDRVAMTYNRLGQMTTRTDQRGVVRTFNYDKLGRLLHDRVTTLSTAEGGIRRISRTYEVRGMVNKISSYSNATVGSGSVVNEVTMDYNEFSQLIAEAQAHSGAVSSSPTVEYDYASGGSSSNQIRLTSITYPGGRQIDYDYGTPDAKDDRLSRVNAIKDGGTALAAYTYLGAGTVIQIIYAEPGVQLDLWGGTTGTFTGIDDFGRVKDQRWVTTGGSPADKDRYKYGYDRNSNRQWRQNYVASGQNLDEYYTYDNLNRLTVMKRGTLTGTPPTGITGTPAREQDWTLDPTGNWNAFVNKTTGTVDLDQARTQSKVNEITGITASTGTNWADPVYDAAGNMTTMPKPSSLANSYTATYDAWNRIHLIKDGATVIGEYQYDGRNRRISNETNVTRNFFYTNNWQIVEERIGNVDVERTYVWGIRYIDELVCRDRDVSGSNERLYATQDANFNVTGLINTSATVVERYTYTPYGVVTFCNASWADIGSSGKASTVLYSGYQYDADTGLYCVRMRYLHPNLGGWLNRVTSLQQKHHYEYVIYVIAPGLFLLADKPSKEPRNEVKLDKYVPPDAKCICAQLKNDCWIDVEFFASKTTRTVTYIPKGGTLKDMAPVPKSYTSGNQSTETLMLGARTFKEGVTFLVTLKSKTGGDVRDCHLRQQVVEHGYKQIDGKKIEKGFVEHDYSILKPETTTNNENYGGWWIFDVPETTVRRDDRRKWKTDSIAEAADQFHAFVEENKSVEAYYGWKATVDWTMKGPKTNDDKDDDTTNIPSTYETWGPDPKPKQL